MTSNRDIQRSVRLNFLTSFANDAIKALSHVFFQLFAPLPKDTLTFTQCGCATSHARMSASVFA